MPTFEEQLAELEKVVDKLERGDLPLEENVILFERGMQLSNACKQQLTAAESRVQVLLDAGDGGGGRVEDIPVDDDEDDSESLDDDEN